MFLGVKITNPIFKDRDYDLLNADLKCFKYYIKKYRNVDDNLKYLLVRQAVICDKRFSNDILCQNTLGKLVILFSQSTHL